jgi:hypothetical protein
MYNARRCGASRGGNKLRKISPNPLQSNPLHSTPIHSGMLRIVAALCLVLIGCVCGVHSDSNTTSVVDVFSQGEGGYFCIKIPSMVVLRSGDIVAFAEGRMHSCSDYTWV